MPDVFPVTSIGLTPESNRPDHIRIVGGQTALADDDDSTYVDWSAWNKPFGGITFLRLGFGPIDWNSYGNKVLRIRWKGTPSNPLFPDDAFWSSVLYFTEDIRDGNGKFPNPYMAREGIYPLEITGTRDPLNTALVVDQEVIDREWPEYWSDFKGFDYTTGIFMNIRLEQPTGKANDCRIFKIELVCYEFGEAVPVESTEEEPYCFYVQEQFDHDMVGTLNIKGERIDHTSRPRNRHHVTGWKNGSFTRMGPYKYDVELVGPYGQHIQPHIQEVPQPEHVVLSYNYALIPNRERGTTFLAITWTMNDGTRPSTIHGSGFQYSTQLWLYEYTANNRLIGTFPVAEPVYDGDPDYRSIHPWEPDPRLAGFFGDTLYMFNYKLTYTNPAIDVSTLERYSLQTGMIQRDPWLREQIGLGDFGGNMHMVVDHRDGTMWWVNSEQIGLPIPYVSARHYSVQGQSLGEIKITTFDGMATHFLTRGMSIADDDHILIGVGMGIDNGSPQGVQREGILRIPPSDFIAGAVLDAKPYLFYEIPILAELTYNAPPEVSAAMQSGIGRLGGALVENRSRFVMSAGSDSA